MRRRNRLIGLPPAQAASSLLHHHLETPTEDDPGRLWGPEGHPGQFLGLAVMTGCQGKASVPETLAHWVAACTDHKLSAVSSAKDTTV